MTERTSERTAVRSGDSGSRADSTARSADRKDDDTAARPPLTERIQAKLAKAADEHRANAGTTTAATRADAGTKPPRRARLRLTRVDPWSVMKTSFLLAVAFGIVTVVSVFIVWSVLGAAGVWDSINATASDILGDEAAAGFDITSYIGTSRVMGFTMLVAVVDVVLLTAVATLGAFLYNMAAALLGGVEVTLAEDH
ncbi:hypothetical protein GCM10009623_18920 [Nocardioides aestuarii]|uniref:DUF3566 domain-containing protein n=1 Tax=Nocardioides aestuarii TaxID=252231 RepID=A0ABW4TNJ3_9ACTN